MNEPDPYHGSLQPHTNCFQFIAIVEKKWNEKKLSNCAGMCARVFIYMRKVEQTKRKMCSLNRIGELKRRRRNTTNTRASKTEEEKNHSAFLLWRTKPAASKHSDSRLKLLNILLFLGWCCRCFYSSFVYYAQMRKWMLLCPETVWVWVCERVFFRWAERRGHKYMNNFDIYAEKNVSNHFQRQVKKWKRNNALCGTCW